MEFAQGAEQALKLLDATPFDVIVSDIKMPGMDGAALLNTICQTHPGIVRIVEQDVAVSAKILQIVNSSFFGLPREISTVRTAVSFFGIDMVQNPVLSAEVFRVFEKAAAIPGFSFEELHIHSQHVAKIAAQIPASSHTRGVAIVAGLLHDVGKLVLATRSRNHFVRALSGAREEGRPLFSVEEELIGVSHAEIGAYLLGIWGLPSPIVEAVAHHHNPERVPQETLDAIAIVHIANFLAHEHPVHPPFDESPPHQAIALEFIENLEIVSQFSEWEDAAEAAAEEMRSGEAAPR